MKKIALCLLFVPFLCLGCTDTYDKPQTPSELHALFSQYFAAKDSRGLQTLFDENAILVADKEGTLIVGRSLIVKSLQAYMDAGTAIETTSASIHINGDIALVKSHWLIADGHITGTSLEVMQYKSGGWVYIIDNPNGY